MSSLGTLNPLRQTAQTPQRASTLTSGLTAQEVFNRITPVTVCAEELRRFTLPTEAHNLVEIIAHSMARTARTARSVARIGECQRVSRTPCNPNDLVSSVVHEFDRVCGALGVGLSAKPAVKCQPVMLDLADFRDGLALLMDVAVDACSLIRSESGPIVEVGVETRTDGVAIVVRGNGEPVSIHVLRQALGALDRSQPPAGGTALALYLARLATTRGGGELRITGEGQWTRFEMVLGLAHGRGRQHLGRPVRAGLRVIDGDGYQTRTKFERGHIVPRIPIAEVSRPVLAMAA